MKVYVILDCSSDQYTYCNTEIHSIYLDECAALLRVDELHLARKKTDYIWYEVEEYEVI